jgi:ABC-2 type transport system ATP-binding protein
MLAKSNATRGPTARPISRLSLNSGARPWRSGEEWMLEWRLVSQPARRSDVLFHQFFSKDHPVIQVKNLRKTYPDGTEAVKGVSFDVQEGEIFGLLGPNGAGKTTIMRMLGTLHDPTGGHARVLDMDVVAGAAIIRRKIGFAMQEVGMDDLASAQEMLMFHASLYGMPKGLAKKETERLLLRFGLEKHADRRVIKFSGGMQRRLDLAVSLIHKPKVLFLDEPSTGLDPVSRADLWDILRELRDDHGLTILLSTHYMEEAEELCDRIGIMDQGNLVAIDTPAHLKRAIGLDTVRLRTSKKPTKKQVKAFQDVYKDIHVDDQTIEIRVRDGAKHLMKVIQLAAEVKLPVVATRVTEPTLDDVFVHHTGQRLQEAEPIVPLEEVVA